MTDKICFVVIGFGIKTDFRTGRQLDLDKTYEYLIKPVFDDLDITCVRACDVPHSGVIDVPMYENILKADIVVADISTLNANAIYELGVRHALRPQTTIVIAENQLTFPFDLNHIAITSYEHLGKDVGAAEVRRFTAELKKMVKQVLNDPQMDSPVYTYLPQLVPPQFTSKEKLKIQKAATKEDSITAMLKEAEELKGKKKFAEALLILKKLEERDPNNSFVIQRIALVRYKSQLPDKVTALKDALNILIPLMPAATNDIETLGLCGAINKRLHEETGLDMYLEKAKDFYERGFIVAKDYYNGVNFGYLLLLSAALATDPHEVITYTVTAKKVRAKTAAICLLRMQTPGFSEDADKVWILLTMAEITFVEKDPAAAQQYLNAAKAEGAPDFAISSYQEQQEKLERLLSKINNK